MKLTEEKMRESFPHFTEAVWAYLGLPSPDRLQWDISEYLQHGPMRRFICGLRGIGKSFETCAYVVWRGWRNGNLVTVVRSGTGEKAKDNVGLMRNIIQVMPILRPMIPKSNEGSENDLKQTDGAFRFDWGTKVYASKDPSVAAYGIGGASVGSHPDIHIDDDIETPVNATTVAARKKLRGLAVEREKMLRDKENGEIIILGTFQSLDSIYKDDIGVFDVRFYPAWYPREGTLPHRHLAPILKRELQEDPTLVDRPTLPQRFPESELLIDEAQDKASHACHMRLNPEIGDIERHPLKLRNLIVTSVSHEVAPATVVWGRDKPVAIKSSGFGNDQFYGPSHIDERWQPYQGSVMLVDPSGTGKDETAWCCGHHLNGNVFISAVGGSRDGHSDETLHRIVSTAKAKGVRRIIVEPNYGGGMFTKLLQSKASQLGWQCGVEDGDWAVGQKELRIIGALEPALNLHRVVVDHEVASDETLMYQLTHITRDRGSLEHEDRLEAFADTVRHFTDQVAVDQEKRLAEAKKAEVLAMVRDLEADIRNPKGGRFVFASMRPEAKMRKRRPRWM